MLGLNPGDKIEIEINRGDKKETLISQVEEVLPDGIVADLPIKKAKYVFLRLDEPVTVIYRIAEFLYGIEARVVAHEKKPIHMVVLKFTKDPQKIQRRNFYRLKTLIPVKFMMVQQQGQMGVEIKEYDGLVKDLSGNGVRLSSHIKLNPGTLLLVKIKLEEFGTVDVKGRVVRSHDEGCRTKVYETGIQFENIDRKTQDKIFMYIFNQLRLLRKKGKV